MRGDRVWEGTAASGGRRKGRTRGEASRETIRVWNYFAILISDVGDFGLRPGQRASRPGGKLRAPPRLLTLICAHAHETHGASATPTTLSAFPRFIDAALRCSPPLLVLRFRLTILRECPACLHGRRATSDYSEACQEHRRTPPPQRQGRGSICT